MHPKIIAVIVIALTLTGCGRVPTPMLVNASTVPIHESKPVEAPPLQQLPVTVLGPPASTAEPITIPTSSSSFKIKDHVIYSGNRNNPKRVALTFDDGPDSKYTDKILDLLKKQNVTATFFIVGEHAVAHKDVMKRIVSDGHEIANHSWSHSDLTKLDGAQLEAEINKTDEIITSFTNQPSTILRPPYGALSQQVVEYAEKNHRIVNWSVDTRDWEGISADRILENVKRETKPGAIILQHSSGGKNGNLANTIQALPQIIAYLKEHGYQFVTVSNLIP